ncbi:hypothetical protein ACIBF1_31250 [Spirillospora sp. NPDC050679]
MDLVSPEGAAAARRARLLTAFVRTVAARGYERTTPAAVTAAARLPDDCFREHFADMDACFLAAYLHHTGLLRARMEAAYRAERSWPDAFAAALGTALRTVAAAPEAARVCVVETSAAGPRVRRARARFLMGLRPLLGGPDAAPVPEVVRDSVIGGLYGTVYAHTAAGRAAELPAQLPAMARFALGYFQDLGQEGAPPAR